MPLSEILYSWIESDLVFLNGCESAEGLMNKGDGKLSLGLSFLIAGGVIEHRWKASDISGSQLASEFYSNYPALQPSKALAEAKRQFLKTSQIGLDHPHYWAGLVYSGSLELKMTNVFFIFISLVILFLLVVALLVIRNSFKHRPISDSNRKIGKL